VATRKLNNSELVVSIKLGVLVNTATYFCIDGFDYLIQQSIGTFFIEFFVLGNVQIPTKKLQNSPAGGFWSGAWGIFLRTI
jgi:hypothetical protein